MPPGDLWGLVFESVRAQPLRSFLTVLGIVIGMAAVVLLSSIGEGTRRGVLAQFSQFGTTIIQVQPGKQKTFGMGPGALGGTTRPLTVEDALALRRVPGVRYVAPTAVGLGLVEAGERSRHTYIVGTTAEYPEIVNWHPRIGTFLPDGDPDQIPAAVVLGAKVSKELLPDQNPLGVHLRAGEARFTVVGVMESKGQVLGLDLDDMIFIPVRRAQRIYDRDTVSEIQVLASSHEMIGQVMSGIKRVLKERHNGEEDVTLNSQADMLGVVNEVMGVLTGGVLVIAAISVFVGAMGILTIQWVSVHERTPEIGLVKALGASDRQVMMLFLAEAGILSLLGGMLGVGMGFAGIGGLQMAIPGLWVQMPAWIIPLALGVSLVVGLVAGVAPAVRAARLDPVEALRTE